MFWNKKETPSPHGVPLTQLCEILSHTSLKAKRQGDKVTVQHPNFVTQVTVAPPPVRDSENGPIKAIVELKTELPAAIAGALKSEGMASAINAMATLGAITTERGQTYVGSRLTVYEQDDAWNIHLPLILFSAIGSVESILGAMRRSFSGESDVRERDTESDWSEDDISQVEAYLSRAFLCTTGGLGLTAEFPLSEGSVSAGAGHHDTALWQLFADQPHPEMGGGLFCLLQLPYNFPDEPSLHRALADLNRREMQPHDLPPHFGAWCAGRIGRNPAYVSFLPNALHSARGIAVNVSFWAANRATWAQRTLAKFGACSLGPMRLGLASSLGGPRVATEGRGLPCGGQSTPYDFLDEDSERRNQQGT